MFHELKYYIIPGIHIITHEVNENYFYLYTNTQKSMKISNNILTHMKSYIHKNRCGIKLPTRVDMP